MYGIVLKRNTMATAGYVCYVPNWPVHTKRGKPGKVS